MSDSNNGNVILGTLIGAAVGFAAGILLAPASGKETRDNLAQKAGELKGDISAASEKAMNSIKEVKEAAERSLKEQANKISS